MGSVVLIAEDDPLLLEFLVAGLRQAGLLACPAKDGEEALELSRLRPFDLYILDRNLPGIDGIGVMKSLRGVGDRTPALMLTSMGEVDDRVSGLDAGADDYMVKPFAIAELLARVRALIRRPIQILPDILTAGQVRLDLAARRVFVGDSEVDLTAQDVALLSVLLRHPRQVFSRDALLDRLNADTDVTPAAIEHAVSRLRRKLAEAGAPHVVETVRGVGYRLGHDAS